MADTIGEAISRVRNSLKMVKEDPFMTDRFIYSLIMKYARTLMHRDKKINNLFKDPSMFREIPCVELIEADKVEACCGAIRTGCTFRRSKYKLPKLTVINGDYAIKALTTIDFSQKLHRSHPSLYTNMTMSSSFKYNKKKYYWISDGYLFIPDVEWEAVRIEALFEEDVAYMVCSTEDNACTPRQEGTLSIPDYLFSEIENMIRQELIMSVQLPSDGADDNQNTMR